MRKIAKFFLLKMRKIAKSWLRNSRKPSSAESHLAIKFVVATIAGIFLWEIKK